jgi:divalent metal cation (Fe/Co/Zn/Cd) transporter
MTRVETILKLMVAFVLICLGFGGIHMAAERIPKLKKIDPIGRVMDAFSKEKPKDR